MSPYGRLLGLVHHRWTIPLLSELHQRSGDRFAALANRLGISRDTLSKTLQDMIKAGWARRNPGYGHPLRPEYILTTKGQAIAPACIELLKSLTKRGVDDLALRKWSLPVVAAIADGHTRFAELKSVLPGVTPRALALALKDVEECGFVARTVVDEFPPTTRYKLTSSGRKMSAILKRMVGKL
jgi:DNA-binding HxlR family transcriptional regulator